MSYFTGDIGSTENINGHEFSAEFAEYFPWMIAYLKDY